MTSRSPQSRRPSFWLESSSLIRDTGRTGQSSSTRFWSPSTLKHTTFVLPGCMLGCLGMSEEAGAPGELMI